MFSKRTILPNLSSALILPALKCALTRLNPFHQIRSPILFVVYVGAVLTSVDFMDHFLNPAQISWRFAGSVSLILWLTILIANFAESIAEGLSKAQATALKNTHARLRAKKLQSPSDKGSLKNIPAGLLKKGDIVLVEAGDFVPADGIVVQGIASVDESAITGESAPVIREPNQERSTVTWGTQVLSDWIIVEVTANRGENYVDHLTDIIGHTKRKKTPNEVALEVFLIATTLGFVITCATLYTFSLYIVDIAAEGTPVSLPMLVGLLVCLTPTTIGGLLSPIGISGMNRLLRANVIATSPRAVEAAGDVSVLLLDKTGTITFGNRQAVTFYPAPFTTINKLVHASLMASIADETPEGQSIVDLALRKHNIKPEKLNEDATALPFSADTRLSGVAVDGRTVLKGAQDAIEEFVLENAGTVPPEIQKHIENIARQGGTPLMVAENNKILGVIHLKDIIKTGIKERLAALRIMGVKSVMITGDNPLTAAAIAAEAGVDDFIAKAIPETKLEYIRKIQETGDLVAMVGDGSNDAPALAQADVAVVMNSGTKSAKEASNMVDLDSDPTKLIEIVKIGKQILMTRGALTTFSLASDVSTFFAIVPAALVSTTPQLSGLNIMHLSTPEHAILASLIFNALIMFLLMPLALYGVLYRPVKSNVLLRHNVLIYGIGGLIIPFIGIKLIDTILFWLMGA